ncbi:MAG: PIN domain-containing protein [Gemmataceae bacterium]|nr:PIN domain-containing protein [Gemmataceae bacterium]
MILLDTGVVIDYLRTGDVKLDTLFQTVPCAVCGVVRAELLHGVRSATDRAQTLTLINGFRHLPTPEPVLDAVGDYLHTLRSKGVTVPFTDVVLAGVAITHDVELWTRDGHFVLIQGVLPALKLFAEPP